MLSDRNTILFQKLYPIISNIKIPKSPPLSDFPSDVLKYMKKNASLKQAFKLMKMNKYFVLEQKNEDFTWCEHDPWSPDYNADLAKNIIIARLLVIVKFMNDCRKHNREYRSTAN
uniref:Uncharacterized protein n=1 Tax=Panagrolaimus davidi TaxID=227884 RepID=A0A914PNJ3_9BILA